MQRVRVSVRQLGDRHFQVNLCNRVTLITQSLLRAGKGGRMARVKAGYFGFTSFDEAQAFADSVRRRYPKARMQVRAGNRLAMAYEVKVSHDAVESLAWELLKQLPTTSQRIERHLKAVSIRPSVAPDSPSGRWANSPVQNRSVNRRTIIGRAGITVGLE